MQSRKEVPSTSLAFIDVMTCGLGAVILLLIMLDFNDVEVQEDLTVSIDSLSDELKKKQSTHSMLESQKKEIDNTVRSLNDKNNDSSASLAALKSLIANEKSEEARLNSQISQLDAERFNDLKRPSKKVKQSILGMSVKGERIFLLLDISKSMSHEKIVDILTSAEPQVGGYNKFFQSKNIFSWLISELPEKCKFNVLAFNDRVNVFSKSMLDCNNKSEKISAVSFANSFEPSDGTSLGVALESVSDFKGGISDIYLITDGLPTIPGVARDAKSKKKCFASGAKVKTISGECRVALFNDAVFTFSKNNPKVKVNIIILPLEGDPKAAPLYWSWASNSGGSFMAPDKKWLN